ncbi:MAG: pitrilysin family protein, partial [bacterium]
MYKKTILPNKLRIITIPLKNTQTASVLFMVKVGSKYETKKISGISHFLEHLFFKGTKNRPSTLDIAKIFDQVGGEYNAFTSQEYTGFYAKVNHKHLELAIEVLSDMLLHSKFDKTEMEKEKAVIIEEINMYQDNPMEYVSNLWHRILFGDQPAGWDIAGTKETVSKITRAEIVNFYKKYYTPANIIVCLAGNLSEKNKMGKDVLKYFTHPKISSYANKKADVKISQNKPNILLQYKKTD